MKEMMRPWSIIWVTGVVLGGRKTSLMDLVLLMLEWAVELSRTRASFISLLSDEDPVLLVNTSAKEDTSHLGIPADVKFHWQLMDIDPLLARYVQLPAVVDDQVL